jgi:hypothetical protein
MKTVSLELNEVLSLEVELAGISNQQTGEVLIEGLLSKELNFSLKYHLDKIYKQVVEEKKVIEQFRQDLIKKFGEESEEGEVSVPCLINLKKDKEGNVVSGDPNPKFQEFSKEFEEFLKTKTEIRVKELTLADFTDVKLKSAPTVLFSLLDEEEELKA